MRDELKDYLRDLKGWQFWTSEPIWRSEPKKAFFYLYLDKEFTESPLYELKMQGSETVDDVRTYMFDKFNVEI